MKKLLHLNNTAFLHLGENLDTLEYSQDGSKLLGIAEYGNKPFISVWDTETGDLCHKILLENKAYNHHFQVFGDTLLYYTHDYKEANVRLYDLQKNEWEMATFTFPRTSYYGALHLKDDELWAFQSEGIFIFDRKTGNLSKQIVVPITNEHENGFAFSADGERLACGNWKTNEVFILNSAGETLKKIEVEGLHDGFGAHIALMQGGKVLVNAYIKQYYQLVVQFWDTETGKLLQKIEKYHRGYVMKLHFSPDEKCLFIKITGIDVLYYEWEIGKLLWEKANVTLNAAVAFSKDGEKLAMSAAKRVLFYEASTGAEMDSQPFGWNNAIENLMYLREKQRLIFKDGHFLQSFNILTEEQETLFEAKEWKWYENAHHGLLLKSEQEILKLNTENFDIQSLVVGKFDMLAFSDKYIATTDHYFLGEKIKKLRLWTHNGKEKKTLGQGKSNLPDYMVFTLDNTQLICVKGKRLWVIAIDTEQVSFDQKCLAGSTSHLLISPDGNSLALLGKTQVQIWDIPTFTQKISLKVPKNILTIAFAFQGSLLLLTSKEGNIYYLDYHSENPKIEKHTLGLAKFADWNKTYLAKDASLWVAMSDCAIQKWDISGLISPVEILEKEGIKGDFAIPQLADSQALLRHFQAANWDFYNPATHFLSLRNLLTVVEMQEGVGELHRFCSEKIMRKGGRLLHRFGHTSPISSFALSPCGTWLATGSWVGDNYEDGGELQIWEVETGRCVNIIDNINGGVGWPDYERCLQWSADSQWLGMAYDTNGVGNINPFGTSHHPANEIYVTDGWSRPPAFCLHSNNEAVHIACWFNEEIPGCIATLGRTKKKYLGFRGKLPTNFPHSTTSNGSPHIEPMKWTNWSKDGKRVYGHNNHSQAFSIDVETGNIAYIMHFSSPIAWSFDDAIFADAAGDIRFFDAKTGNKICSQAISISPSDMMWANILEKRILAVWSVNDKEVLIFENEQPIFSIKTELKAEYWNFPDGKAWTFSLDAKKGASLSPDGEVSIWDLEQKGELLLTFPVQTQARGILWGKNDTLIAINEDILSFWDTKTGDCLSIQHFQMPEGVVYPSKEDYPLFTPKKDLATQFEVNPSFPIFKNGQMQWITAFENGLVICPLEWQNNLRQELAYSINNKWVMPYYWRKENVILDMTGLQKNPLNPLSEKDTKVLQPAKNAAIPRSQLVVNTSFEELLTEEERKNFWKDTVKRAKIQEFEMAIKDIKAYKVPNPLKGEDINQSNMAAFLGKSVMYAENWRPNYRQVVTITGVEKEMATYFYASYKDGKPTGGKGSGSMTYTELLFVGLVEGK